MSLCVTDFKIQGLVLKVRIWMRQVDKYKFFMYTKLFTRYDAFA